MRQHASAYVSMRPADEPGYATSAQEFDQLHPGVRSEEGSVTGVSTMPLNPAATEFVTFAAPAVSAVSKEADDSDSSLPELVESSSSEDDSEDDEPVPASPFWFSHKHPEGLHMNGHEFHDFCSVRRQQDQQHKQLLLLHQSSQHFFKNQVQADPAAPLTGQAS
jgi:hypothetical protein